MPAEERPPAWGAAPVPFDRAADTYDQTRSLPEETMRAVVDVLRAELSGRGPTLEIGVGTGRIALPLHREGLAMVGVDLSLPMLRKLVETAGGSAPFPVAMADALALPFADRAFGSALAVHVLHLIPSWERAVEELVRVMRPGGRILVDVGGWGPDWLVGLHRRFCDEAGTAMFPGVTEAAEVERALGGRGATMRRLVAGREERTVTVERYLAWMEEGTFSYTWSVPEDERVRIARRVRAWAQERYGTLTEPRRLERDIVWWAFDLP